MGLQNCYKKLLLSGEQKQRLLPYAVGALLYAPATNDKIVRYILQQKCEENYSASLCLEDSINDASVDGAEEKIVSNFMEIGKALEKNPNMYLPEMFIRVRRPQQITDLYSRLGENANLLTGFIAPKYSPQCAKDYNRSILAVNEISKDRVYMMPTLESRDIVTLASRAETLQELRERVDEISDIILNIRVGGNDFCNAFGIRRSSGETIYDIGAVSRILSDIITVFSPDYVVSGPVWEYFSGTDNQWKTGLSRELKLDKLNGFIGKTVIHPNQIPIVNSSLAVSRKDCEDAQSILNWPSQNSDMVLKNQSGERMNEIKVHTRWAKKISILSEIYGVIE